MSSYNILSLDGGGSRGVVTACLVEALGREVPGFVTGVDLFAGSSIGAANAFSMALDGTTDGMVEFYRRYGSTLFSERYQPGGLLGGVLKVVGGIPVVGRLAEDVESLFYPKWSNEGLEYALGVHYGDHTMSDLGETRVLATTVKMNDHVTGVSGAVAEPVLMTNYPSSPYSDLELRTVLLRSMSAPTYFESTSYGYVDGGVFAANPALAAVGVAVGRAGCDLGDVRVLSIGTGRAADGAEAPEPLAWGLIKWGEHFPNVTVDAVSDFDNSQCEVLLGDSFMRLNPGLPRPFAMDDYAAIPELIEIAERATETEAFSRAVDFVRENFAPDSA